MTQPISRGVMLALYMGTGKSLVTVALICDLPIFEVLITMPRAVLENEVWQDQFAQHADVPYKTYNLRTKAGLTALAQPAQPGVRRIFMVNYDMVYRPTMSLLQREWDLIVCDEAHKIKAPGGKASRHLYTLGKKAKRRLCLTGTPMAHSPLDLYGQYRFLDETVLGTSFTRFRAKFAVVDAKAGFPIVRGYQNQQELNALFYSRAIVVQDDVLDLPEKHHFEHFVHLSSEARQIYKALEKEFIAGVQGGFVTAANAGVKILRLQQITSGYVMATPGLDLDPALDSPEKVIQEVDDSKYQALVEIMDDLDPTEPLVVFCRFHHDLDRVHAAGAATGRAVAELSGRIDQLKLWKEHPETTVLAVQIQSGGAGIDLTRTRYAVYYSVGYSLGDFEQSVKRVHRPGQTRKVTYIHLVAKNTQDQVIYRALKEGKNIVESILFGYNLSS